MTQDVDICNRALSEIGARAVIQDLATDTSSAAMNCRLHYQPLRQQLIRAAPWAFCRKTISMTLLGSLTDTPPGSPYPWQSKYAYPSDCLKVRYILPPPPPVDTISPVVGEPLFYSPWCGPRRDWRFLIANDDTTGLDTKVILSNVCQALLVYNKDVVSPDAWDAQFQDALVAALASKIVLAITGNAGMKQSFVQIAQGAITTARMADGNESLASTDHTPDWIQTRGVGSPFGYSPFAFTSGQWYGGWDQMNWGA
jgi:hypothetical protein